MTEFFFFFFFLVNDKVGGVMVGASCKNKAGRRDKECQS